MNSNWSFLRDSSNKERFLRRYLRHYGVSFEQAKQLLEQTTIRLEPLIRIDLKYLKDFFDTIGIKVSNKEADITLSITNSFLASEDHDAIIKHSLAAKSFCLPVQADIVSIVGPYIDPSSDFCWDCFKSNLNRQNGVEQALTNILPPDTPVAEQVHLPPLIANSLLNHVARCLLRFILTPERYKANHTLFVSNNAIGEEETLEYVRWARCTHCRNKPQETGYVRPGIDLHQTLGDIEASANQETLEQNVEALKTITNPYTGVLKTLSPVTSRDSKAGLFMAVSRHPFYNYLPSELSSERS
ncbi:MAG: TOMM precursor leader peptide-binding protein [Rhodothermaceae bacterium]|nr:TOMM precursor leader peptide-binding protein [Rhodothermaceae bacterium]